MRILWLLFCLTAVGYAGLGKPPIREQKINDFLKIFPQAGTYFNETLFLEKSLFLPGDQTVDDFKVLLKLYEYYKSANESAVLTKSFDIMVKNAIKQDGEPIYELLNNEAPDRIRREDEWNSMLSENFSDIYEAIYKRPPVGTWPYEFIKDIFKFRETATPNEIIERKIVYHLASNSDRQRRLKNILDLVGNCYPAVKCVNWLTQHDPTNVSCAIKAIDTCRKCGGTFRIIPGENEITIFVGLVFALGKQMDTAAATLGNSTDHQTAQNAYWEFEADLFETLRASGNFTDPLELIKKHMAPQCKDQYISKEGFEYCFAVTEVFMRFWRLYLQYQEYFEGLKELYPRLLEGDTTVENMDIVKILFNNLEKNDTTIVNIQYFREKFVEITSMLNNSTQSSELTKCEIANKAVLCLFALLGFPQTYLDEQEKNQHDVCAKYLLPDPTIPGTSSTPSRVTITTFAPTTVDRSYTGYFTTVTKPRPSPFTASTEQVPTLTSRSTPSETTSFEYLYASTSEPTPTDTTPSESWETTTFEYFTSTTSEPTPTYTTPSESWETTAFQPFEYTTSEPLPTDGFRTTATTEGPRTSSKRETHYFTTITPSDTTTDAPESSPWPSTTPSFEPPTSPTNWPPVYSSTESPTTTVTEWLTSSSPGTATTQSPAQIYAANQTRNCEILTKIAEIIKDTKMKFYEKYNKARDLGVRKGSMAQSAFTYLIFLSDMLMGNIFAHACYSDVEIYSHELFQQLQEAFVKGLKCKQKEDSFKCVTMYKPMLLPHSEEKIKRLRELEEMVKDRAFIEVDKEVKELIASAYNASITVEERHEDLVNKLIKYSDKKANNSNSFDEFVTIYIQAIEKRELLNKEFGTLLTDALMKQLDIVFSGTMRQGTLQPLNMKKFNDILEYLMNLDKLETLRESVKRDMETVWAGAGFTDSVLRTIIPHLDHLRLKQLEHLKTIIPQLKHICPTSTIDPFFDFTTPAFDDITTTTISTTSTTTSATTTSRAEDPVTSGANITECTCPVQPLQCPPPQYVTIVNGPACGAGTGFSGIVQSPTRVTIEKQIYEYPQQYMVIGSQPAQTVGVQTGGNPVVLYDYIQTGPIAQRRSVRNNNVDTLEEYMRRRQKRQLTDEQLYAEIRKVSELRHS